MCGIFGYIGKQENVVELCLQGIKRLEYRGYDSAGIAGMKDGKILSCKEVGPVSKVEQRVREAQVSFDSIGIAHTRWATHGKPTQTNAHPHFDSGASLALVHNGIIENHDALREILREQGIQCESETDTEVVAHLISMNYSGDILSALQATMPLLQGSFALALVHRDYPDALIVSAKDSPLAVGLGNGEAFVASDTNAFLLHTQEVVYIESSEVAIVCADHLKVFDETSVQVSKSRQWLEHCVEDATKGDYEHFTLKEIHEQPQSIRNALLARFMEDYGNVKLEGLNLDINELLSVERILILACGTSWHAGYAASYMLEDKARIPVQVEISSEFRYKNPVVADRTLVLAISQSGETADTLAAMRELKAKGARIIAITNVQGSTLAREADSTLFLKAGPEIGVCSTKAFTSQLVVLSLFTLLLARMRHMSKAEGQTFIRELKQLPDVVEKVLEQEGYIERLALKYAHYENFFFIGRHYMYPMALEGALKLKEISYVNANGYPAGELKHGPIALINEQCPTVAFCANQLTIEKTLSNLKEIHARSGPLLVIAQEGTEGVDKVADDIIWVPRNCDELATLPSSVAAQLFAYYFAKARGAEIDKPRNLAKSVTVE